MYGYGLNFSSCNVVLPAGKGTGTAIGLAKAWPNRAITAKPHITVNICVLAQFLAKKNLN